VAVVKREAVEMCEAAAVEGKVDVSIINNSNIL